MPFVTSADGTRIGYETRGSGSPLLLVDGAMCSRDMGPMPAIAEALSDRFGIYLFDRRGRGESGNTLPWSMDREIEDISALVAEIVEKTGEPPMVFGISSGAILAARAAAANTRIRRLALYEAPMIVDDTHAPMPADFVARVRSEVERGRAGAAAKLFMAYVGMPGIAVFIMSLLPFWKKVTVNAHTLPYDLSLVEPLQKGKRLDHGAWAGVTMETLVLDGGKSPAYMRNAQRHWANTLPNARYDTLPGQTHNVKTEAIAPVLATFFSERLGQAR
ncbi:MAG: lysophospholipase [Alphaproteobacteria bacterium]|nr:lysophospholipase [Alphaproteobacteria bacterium]